MSVDLKTKLANIDTEYQTLCYRLMAYEQAYDDISAEEPMSYIKQKMDEIQEMWACVIIEWIRRYELHQSSKPQAV